MVRAFDAIKDITEKKEIWKLAVKIESLWTVKRGSDYQIEFIIRDVKGDTIHVTITPDEVKKREADVQELMKLKTQTLQNFRVQKYDARYKWTDHPYKLMFISGTKVFPNDDIPDMPVCGFKFKSIPEIKSGNFREDLLVDVIGAVHQLGSPQTTMGGKLKFAFTIQDLSANVIDCCLWDSLAAQFIDFFKIRTDSGPIVLIVKHARLKHPVDNYPLQVTNAWNGTFLLINDDIPAINDFKKRLPADNTYAIQSNITKSSSQMLSQGSISGSNRSPQDKFIMGHPFMKIKDIIKLPKDKICVTVGTTSHIRVSGHGWSFPGCKDCIKQCYGATPPFKCKDGHQTDDPIIRYRIDVEVFDGDDSAKFVFWDNTCIDLLGITSSELKQKLLALGVTDPCEYPEEIDEMMGRKFAFRVNWQSDWKQCSVLACLDSKVMVDTLEAELQNHQLKIGGSSSVNIKETQDSHDEIQSGIKDENLFEPVPSITEGVSATSENDPDIDETITPTKVAPTPHIVEEIIAAQLSSTKTALKPRVAPRTIAARVSSDKTPTTSPGPEQTFAAQVEHTKSSPPAAIPEETIAAQLSYLKTAPTPPTNEETIDEQRSNTKRQPPPRIPEETIAAQLSSTKLKKRIKKEK